MCCVENHKQRLTDSSANTQLLKTTDVKRLRSGERTPPLLVKLTFRVNTILLLLCLR